jgi:sarcosine oxidase, subunit gamma
MQKSAVNKVIQKSPIAHAQIYTSAKWEVINDMEIAVEYASDDIEQIRKQVLGITDVSCCARFGVKGPNATQWLLDHGLSIPINANAWTLCEQKTLVLRLGSTEYLIEDWFGGSACSRLANDMVQVPSVFKVPREDAAFIVSGSEALNLFSELCSLDLRDKSLDAKDLIMTQVAGISAIVMRQSINNEPVYRMWCDGTYGPYMWEILQEVATELGGGTVGLRRYLTKEI